MNYDLKQVIDNQKRENKFSHAYLVETNNFEKFDSELKEILKSFLCEESKTHCNKCQNCHYIDEGVHPNVLFIYPDGAHIKVGQIEDLRNKFSVKSTYGKYNIYVIFNAEKLNPNSSNALLKFLEEPEDNIIGILLTKNKSLLLPTIISRCQSYVKLYDEVSYDDNIVELASQLENLNDNWNGIIDFQDFMKSLEDKNDIKLAFAYLLEKEIKKNNNFKKIEVLQDIVNKIRYNVNVDLIVLDYLLRVREIDE